MGTHLMTLNVICWCLYVCCTLKTAMLRVEHGRSTEIVLHASSFLGGLYYRNGTDDQCVAGFLWHHFQIQWSITCLLFLISFTLRLCFGIITGEAQHEDEWRWQKGFGRPKLQQSFHRIQCWWMFSCFKKHKVGKHVFLLCSWGATQLWCDHMATVVCAPNYSWLVDILVAMAAMD